MDTEYKTLYYKHNFRLWNFRKMIFKSKFSLKEVDKNKCIITKISSEKTRNNLVNEKKGITACIHGQYIAVAIPSNSCDKKDIDNFFQT